MLQNNTAKLLKLIILLVSAIVVAICITAYVQFSNLKVAIGWVEHTYEVNQELGQLQLHIINTESSYKDLLVTKDTVYNSDIERYKTNVLNAFSHVRFLTSDNNYQQKNLDTLKSLIDKHFNIITIRRSRTKLGSIVGHMEATNGLISSIKALIQTMILHENELLDQRQTISQRDQRRVVVVFLLIILLLLSLLITGYIKIYKDYFNLNEKNKNLELFKDSANQSEIVGRYGSWSWHIDQETLSYSDNLYRLLGEQPQSFKATLDNFVSYIHPEDKSHFSEQIDKMFRSEELSPIHYRVLTKKGGVSHMKALGKLLYTSQKNATLYITMTDVSEERDRLRLIEKRNLELERKNKELSAFNHIASHDLQEPLRKIQTFISRLESEDYHSLSNRGRMYFERIVVASRRMRQLLSDLLQFSRVENGKKEFYRTDMNQIVKEVKAEFSEDLAEVDGLIIADPLPTTKVIPYQIKQLFSNLISNSIKYKNLEKKPTIHIEHEIVVLDDPPKIAETLASPSYHLISYSDNGIGFSDEYSKKIFDLFYRLHSNETYSGTGVGLAICKKIVENHRGMIKASSKQLQGALFEIYLPIES